jgi:hypothetical protein
MRNHKEEVKQIAEQIIKSSDLPEEYGSIILLIGMISIILTTIRIIQECNKNKQFASNQDQTDFYRDKIRELSGVRGWYTKMRIKKLLRNEMKRDDYRKYANSIVNAMLDYGEKITTDECSYLIGE